MTLFELFGYNALNKTFTYENTLYKIIDIENLFSVYACIDISKESPPEHIEYFSFDEQPTLEKQEVFVKNDTSGKPL